MAVGTLVLAALGVASIVAGTERPPIIDVHQHAHGMRYLPDGSPPPRLCVNDPAECDNPPSKYTTDDGLLEGTLEYMRRYNIVRAASCEYSVAVNVVLEPRELCWMKLLRSRCGAGDACLVTCLATGVGRCIAGGCWHACNTFRVYENWKGPEAWDNCPSIPEPIQDYELCPSWAAGL